MDARLRNQTYLAPLHADVSTRAIKKGHDGEEVTVTTGFRESLYQEVEKQRLLIKQRHIHSLQQRETLDESRWHNLVEIGFSEYVDTETEEKTIISMTIDGTRFSGEDIIIGKTTPVAADGPQGQASRYTKHDHCIVLRNCEAGIVDQVLLTTDADGLRLV
ncbi:hypothetical protein MLD38_019340 [Melastoma candidum]|uniref:Uncharacterized protein n=1 Tax=Melastoma candidum TaxID=119954 RepID=A0ACB9QYK6_9MYRT|nr:hypothetical protein MLD38_019340 [Melastoma candidum]